MDVLSGNEATFGLAFLAGFLSLISPCVLALVPAYLTYLSGVSVRASATEATNARTALIVGHAALFVAGFTIVFVAFGASATLVGRFFIVNQRLLAQIAGVLVAGFGLHTIGWLRIPWLDREKRMTYRGKSGKPHHSLVIGMAFAAGWTPCVGPILGAILAMASVSATVWQGVVLLLFYAAGMGLPFLLMAATLGRSNHLVAAIKRRYRAVEIASGLLLIAIGVMLYTDTFSLLARYFSFLIL